MKNPFEQPGSEEGKANFPIDEENRGNFNAQPRQPGPAGAESIKKAEEDLRDSALQLEGEEEANARSAKANKPRGEEWETAVSSGEQKKKADEILEEKGSSLEMEPEE